MSTKNLLFLGVMLSLVSCGNTTADGLPLKDQPVDQAYTIGKGINVVEFRPKENPGAVCVVIWIDQRNVERLAISCVRN